MTPVRRVLTSDTQKDLSAFINDYAEALGFDAVAFVGLLIAESGLREGAAREAAWPDVSYGLTQVAVKWIGAEVPSFARANDGTVLDTPSNRATARAYFINAARAITYSAPRFSALWKRAGGNAQRCLEMWNAPNLDWSSPNLDAQHRANRENYRRALAQAAQYAVAADQPQPHPGGHRMAVQDVRGQLPHAADVDAQYEPRPLANVVGVTIHYTDGDYSDTPESVARYQISQAAASQTVAYWPSGLPRPFPTLAYSYFVTQDGTPYYANDIGRRTWHSGAPGVNDTTFSVCFACPKNAGPLPAQIDGIAVAIQLAESLLGRKIGAAHVEGHKDHMSTDCPGPYWPAFKPKVLAALEQARRDAVSVIDDVTNGHYVGPGFLAFLQANPEYGRARFDEQWFPDRSGTFLWTTATPEHPKGSLLIWRQWQPIVVKVVTWDD